MLHQESNVVLLLVSGNFTSDHFCRHLNSLQSKEARQNWVAQQIIGRLEDTHGYSPSEIVSDICRDEDLSINYLAAWRAKEISVVDGDERDSYLFLKTYCQKLEEFNLRSTAIVEQDGQSFIAYAASIKGFKWCRPLMYGTHLKNKYKGILLAAVAYNPNDGMTLALAVVDIENSTNWYWLLDVYGKHEISRLNYHH